MGAELDGRLSKLNCRSNFKCTSPLPYCHTETHARSDSSERVVSSSHRSLAAHHTTNTRDERPCPQRVSDPRTQQSSGRRPTNGYKHRLRR